MSHPDELIDFIARTRALNTSPFAKASPERPFRLATAFCDGSLVYTYHATREAAEEAYEALAAHHGALMGDVGYNPGRARLLDCAGLWWGGGGNDDASFVDARGRAGAKT
jgi:hypothetical protein